MASLHSIPEELHTPGALLKLMTEHQVAAACAVSVASVRRWRVLGAGPRYLKIGCSVRYKLEDVRSWIESRPTRGGGQAS